MSYSLADIIKITKVMKSGGEMAGRLRDVAEKAELATDIFLGEYGQEAADKLGQAAEKLGQLAEAVEKAEKFWKAGENVFTIYKVWNELNTVTIQNNPRKAARLFGQLFASAGEVAQTLPVPGIQILGRFLAEFGSFFSNMYEKIAPDGAQRTMGRQMRQLRQMEPGMDL